MANNWPNEKFERGPLDAVDEKRNSLVIEVIQQWQDGAIMFAEMVNALAAKLTPEDRAALDEMAGIKRSRREQVWPDQTCPCCKYVATIAGVLDVWLCDGDRTDTVSLIVRHGGEPHEYASHAFRHEEWERALVAKMNRYATTVDLDLTRRHCIIDMVLEHLPCTIINASCFPK